MEQFEKVCKGLEKLDNEAYSRWVHCQYTQDALIKGVGDYVQPALALIRQQRERIAELEAKQTARVMTLDELDAIYQTKE